LECDYFLFLVCDPNLKRDGVRGTWRNPTRPDFKPYTRVLLGVLAVDFGSKAFFFRYDRPHPVRFSKTLASIHFFTVPRSSPFMFIFRFTFCIRFYSGRCFSDSPTKPSTGHGSFPAHFPWAEPWL
jgi:hypothetical protein